MPINKIAYQVLEENQQNYINILRTGQSVSDVGWSTYADPAGTNPVDGVGGTASITWAQNTVGPLSGDSDLRLVKDAVNRQGNGVSTPFTIANRHLGKVLQITFDAELITETNTYENPILVPVTGIYSISSTTCTVTATHNFIQGQSVFMTFTSGSPPVNGFYTITSVTATTFVFTVASGSSTGNCNYTTIGDIRISIIQDPTGTPMVLEPVNTNLQLGITNQRIRHIASFQTHISISSYRLCIHVGSASTVAYTVDFANFKIWEPTQSIGAVITEPVSYTPTFVGMSPTSVVFTWQRVGKNIKIKGRGIVASNTSTQWSITTPNGIIPDLGYTSGDGVFVGTMIRGAASDGNLLSMLGRNDNLIRLGSYIALNAGGSPLAWGSNNPFGTGEAFNVDVEFPVLGWGSSVAMSSDSGDGRVVGLFLTGTPSSSISGNAAATWSSVSQIRDTHGAYNSTTGIYTAPISGFYSVSGHFNTNLSVNVGIYPWINGVQVAANFGVSPSSGLVNFSGQVFLNSGDQLTLRPTSGWSAVSGGSFLNISRISAGSQVIASSETVAARYEKTDGTNVLSSATDMIYNLRIRDTHGAYNTANGEYTVPISGYYQINCIVGLSTGSLYNIHVLKNGSVTDFTTVGGVTTMNRRNLSTGNYYLAGDKIKIQALADTTRSIDTQAGANTLFICRLGI